MPNRVSINSIDAGMRVVSGELNARHLKSLCIYNYASRYFCTHYGDIPHIDVLAALNGDSDMFQLRTMQFTLSLSEN